MLRLFLEVSMLAFAAQQAIWLRSMKIAAGGRAAKRETDLMVKEKISAAQAAVFKAATGTGPVAITTAIGAKCGPMSDVCPVSVPT